MQEFLLRSFPRNMSELMAEYFLEYVKIKILLIEYNSMNFVKVRVNIECLKIILNPRRFNYLNM